MHPELLLLIGISLSLGFTPGPNNAVAAYSGFNFGIRKTLPLILGVGFGYTALIILINFVLISTFKNYPIIQEIIRVLGTIFLIYLAYKISFSKISSDGKTENPVKFLDKFIFQFINPKGVIVAMIAVSTFIDVQNNYLRDALIVIITYFFMAVFSVSSWCLLGKYLRNFATSETFIKKFNYTMSFLLIVCVIMFYV